MPNIRTQIMGILNVTPDSFSDGGQYTNVTQAVARAFEMCAQGADIIDIGGESTRPGAAIVGGDEEQARILPVIKALISEKIPAQISIDTRRPDIAKAAVEAGAQIWNDVTGLSFRANSIAMAADLECSTVLMHMQGTPETMQDKPSYGNVGAEVKVYLKERMQAAIDGGVKPHNIILDPGIGFGKRLGDNLALLEGMDDLHALGCPILIGASRKSFISMIDECDASERLGGSIASALWATSLGASILRVHDVQETAQALKVWQAIQEHKPTQEYING